MSENTFRHIFFCGNSLPNTTLVFSEWPKPKQFRFSNFYRNRNNIFDIYLNNFLCHFESSIGFHEMSFRKMQKFCTFVFYTSNLYFSLIGNRKRYEIQLHYLYSIVVIISVLSFVRFRFGFCSVSVKFRLGRSLNKYHRYWNFPYIGDIGRTLRLGIRCIS